MARADDLLDDFKVLGGRLDGVLIALDDPEQRASGSDAAALARERRILGGLLADVSPGFDQAVELRRDFDRLEEALGLSVGSGAAAVARERRIMGDLLVALEKPAGEVPLVDQLAERRLARGRDSGVAGRRRQSG